MLIVDGRRGSHRECVEFGGGPRWQEDNQRGTETGKDFARDKVRTYTRVQIRNDRYAPRHHLENLIQ